MPTGATAFVAGTILGCVLVTLGAFIGFITGRRKGRSQMAGIDTERVLSLIQELSRWTNEYSGNVSTYQDQIGQLRSAVASAESSQDIGKLGGLLERIMESNRSLQSRLEAAEIQLERQRKQIEEYLSEARTDALTGIANRRAFDRKLDEMFGQFRRGGKRFCIGLIDIDHFKAINDQWGHPAGDVVLRQIARLLTDQLEGAYVVARFGGEEFAVLLPGPLPLAGERLNKVRRILAKQPIQIEARSIPVTISIGLAEPREEILIGPIVRRADEALYAAKNRGRNRVYFHDGQQPVLVGAPEVSSPVPRE